MRYLFFILLLITANLNAQEFSTDNDSFELEQYSGEVYVQSANGQPFSVELMNSMGQVLAKYNPQTFHKIALEGIPAGILFVRLTDENQITKTKKIYVN